MIGSLVGSAVGIMGSIFGGMQASQAMQKYKRNVEDEKAKNAAWYDRQNGDATQRADAQRILTKTQEAIRDRNRAASGTQAVMGGTEESVAATKAANSQALAEAASQIAVAGDRRKDAIEQQFQQRDRELQNELNNIEINKARAISQAIGGVGQAASSMGGAF